MEVPKLAQNLVNAGPVFREAAESGNVRALASMLGPAYRGLVRQIAKDSPATRMRVRHDAFFDWTYARGFPEMRTLYEAAKTSQWNGATDLDWSIQVDPNDPRTDLLPESYLPIAERAEFRSLDVAAKRKQILAITSWILSQFLHGEQGALFAAAQVTQAVPWMDGKLYGGTQVMDEARHVEVFHTYLTQKLEKRYEINDNLYVIIDALMSDARWDVKFLGMQIMVEGLALGAFGSIRKVTREPLLKDLLKLVITDEARHVHYGVLALKASYDEELSEKERRDREDWTFEVTLLLRNRFLVHEFYDEYWAHAMTRKEWDALVLASPIMSLFRETMFKRIIPNLKRIGLLSERVRSRYDALGLLKYEGGRAAPDLTAADLLEA